MDYLSVASLQAGYMQNGAMTPVIRDFKLTLSCGAIGALIGPSGCGKSTFLSILAGLNRAYQGTVLIKGKGLAESNRTALILQDYGLLPWKTVGDNVGLGLRIKGLAKKEIALKTEQILDKMGLLFLKKRYPAQLSGGQRQRIAIARSLVLEPELLLMDEPFSSLDALTREEMQDFLLEVWQGTGLTILLVTHNIEEAVFLGQKIFIMSQCPGTVIKELDNPLAGDYEARGKIEFLATTGALRSSLRG